MAIEGTICDSSGKFYRYPFRYLAIALEDYRASRMLLLRKSPVVAVTLGATAIEKQLKAIYYLGHPLPEKNFRHKMNDLYSELILIDPSVEQLVRGDFISELMNYYEYRYIENKQDCRLSVCCLKFLIDLDTSFVALDEHIRAEYWAEPSPTPLQSEIERRHDSILSKNIALGEFSAGELLAQGDDCLEWIFPPGSSSVTHIRATYRTKPD